MAEAYLALQAVAAAAGAIGMHQAAQGEAANLDAQARLADTQALQRDTINRDELTRFLSSMQAARSANGLSDLSPNAFALRKEASNNSDRDRLTQRADDRQRASNFRSAAKGRRRSGRTQLFAGLGKAAGAGYSFYEYGRS